MLSIEQYKIINEQLLAKSFDKMVSGGDSIKQKILSKEKN